MEWLRGGVASSSGNLAYSPLSTPRTPIPQWPDVDPGRIPAYRILVVGAGGVGKTTLCELICRLGSERGALVCRIFHTQPPTPKIRTPPHPFPLPVLYPLLPSVGSAPRAAATLQTAPAPTIGCTVHILTAFQDRVTQRVLLSPTPNTNPIFIELLDVSGATRFGSLRSLFCGQADGVWLVHDTGSPRTLEALDRWLADVTRALETAQGSGGSRSRTECTSSHPDHDSESSWSSFSARGGAAGTSYSYSEPPVVLPGRTNDTTPNPSTSCAKSSSTTPYHLGVPALVIAAKSGKGGVKSGGGGGGGPGIGTGSGLGGDHYPHPHHAWHLWTSPSQLWGKVWRRTRSSALSFSLPSSTSWSNLTSLGGGLRSHGGLGGGSGTITPPGTPRSPLPSTAGAGLPVTAPTAIAPDLFAAIGASDMVSVSAAHGDVTGLDLEGFLTRVVRHATARGDPELGVDTGIRTERKERMGTLRDLSRVRDDLLASPWRSRGGSGDVDAVMGLGGGVGGLPPLPPGGGGGGALPLPSHSYHRRRGGGGEGVGGRMGGGNWSWGGEGIGTGTGMMGGEGRLDDADGDGGLSLV